MIRHAQLKDLDAMLNIYSLAREFMRNTGNPNQWNNNYPERALLEKDIEQGNSYVLDDGSQIYGTFAFIKGIDPTFIYIKGQWLNDEPYGTIHRIASNRTHKGIFEEVINYCLNEVDNVRIDTHHDNKVMQKVVKNHKFIECGIIYLENGDERIAYQLVK